MAEGKSYVDAGASPSRLWQQRDRVTEGGIGKGWRIRHDKVQTFVFVNDEDAWRCAAFQNTKQHGLLVWINARATANPGGSDRLSLGRVGERDPKATM